MPPADLRVATMKFPEYVGIKLPADLAETARQLAAKDDRPFSTFLRRLIVEGVTRRTSEQQQPEAK